MEKIVIKMTYEDFLKLCTDRRSVRNFNNKSINDEDIRKIILAGIQAPSGTNTQGWQFRLINDKSQIQNISLIVERKIGNIIKSFDEYETILKDSFDKYSKNFIFFKNAPLLLLLYSKKPRNMVKRFFGTGLKAYKGEGNFLSLGMVMQNMMLASHILGISTCALNGPLVAEKEINDEYPCPARHELSALLCFGYTDIQPASPGRKPIEKFIIE